MKTTIILLFAACAAPAQWPTPKTSIEAYDFVNARREEAGKLWHRSDPKGIEMDLQLLPYLDQPIVADLSSGNPFLAARRLNIYLDLAEAYAIQQKNDESLRYIGKVVDLLPNPSIARFIEGNDSFSNLRSDPEFRRLMSEFRKFENFWDSPALSTPYKTELNDAEKLAGLSKFWSEVKYNFGYPEKLIALDWDRLYLEWIPRVLAAKTTEVYYKELMRLCARLEDGHTNVNAPEAVDDSLKPPLRTGLIEGKVMIFEVTSPSLESEGLKAGMEIVEVDGEPAVAYARREVEPFQSAATPQDRDIRTFGYGFLRGPRMKAVRLTLRDSAGTVTTKEIARQGFRDVRGHSLVEWKLLPGNIAYVALNGFDSNDAVTQWRAALPRIADTRALILDVRRNGGGSTSVGFEVLRDLVDHPFLGSRQVMRKYNPTERARGDLMSWTELRAEPIEPRGGQRYSKPVVVLSGAATYSAAEDFLVAWKNSGRGKTIGEPSGGSTGQPLNFKLPGGGSARVCTKRDTFPDGREWVGKGIEPDILIRPTVRDVQAGRDAVLERAVAYLAP